MLRRRTMMKTAITGDTHTKLLLHLDGNVTDSSIYSVTTSASSGTSYATGKFGQCFIGIYLETPETPSPIVTPSGFLTNIISSDFTIEMWIDSNSFDPINGAQLMSIGLDNTNQYVTLSANISAPVGSPLSHYISIYTYLPDDSTTFIDALYPATSMSGWFHFALTLSGTVLRVFINGTLVGLYNSFDVGYDPDYADSILIPSSIKVDEIRISDIARWTADFTPPTAPYA